MIKDKIENIKLYENISVNLTNAILTMQEETFLQDLRQNGRIDGDGFFVTLQRYETKPVDKGRWETHRRYIDIQYVLSGEEMVGYTNIGNLNEIYESDSEKDFYFYKYSKNEDWLTVRNGEFLIFFETDGHKPSLHVNNKSSNIEKVVFKVEV